ncbi:MAG: cupin domain-containing protein [Gammaproteobacteria bacterium]|jgi:mannose-6-phosphate isomerase-like protein (cupin superfamily)
MMIKHTGHRSGHALSAVVAVTLLVVSATARGHGDAVHPAANDRAAGTTTTPAPAYPAATRGTRELVAGPVTIRMLIEQANLGHAGVEVGELELPVAYGEGAAHAHGSLEIFYVVEGILGHEVNGVAHRLEPGMAGFVKPGDRVRHAVLSEEPVRAVVIWLPGGEADRLVEHAGFASRPLGTTAASP